jgi:hypothetical protein
MSDMQNVITPVGSVDAQPARRRSTSSPAWPGGARDRLARPAVSAASKPRGLRRVEPLPTAGSTPPGGAPVSRAKAVAASA